jgi:hypothetical protein
MAVSHLGGEAELWDLTRPLIGDCNLELLKFDDPEAKAVRNLHHLFSLG